MPPEVVVGTYAGSPWLTGCLASLGRPAAVYESTDYEIGVLRQAVQRHERFLFLQDSVRVLDPGFWEAVGTEPTWLCGRPPMYLGIYDAAALGPLLAEFPATVDKETAIACEGLLHERLPMPCVWPDVVDRNALRQEHKHGRNNLVLGNALFEKFKGTWR